SVPAAANGSFRRDIEFFVKEFKQAAELLIAESFPLDASSQGTSREEINRKVQTIGLENFPRERKLSSIVMALPALRYLGVADSLRLFISLILGNIKVIRAPPAWNLGIANYYRNKTNHIILSQSKVSFRDLAHEIWAVLNPDKTHEQNPIKINNNEVARGSHASPTPKGASFATDNKVEVLKSQTARTRLLQRLRQASWLRKIIVGLGIFITSLTVIAPTNAEARGLFRRFGPRRTCCCQVYQAYAQPIAYSNGYADQTFDPIKHTQSQQVDTQSYRYENRWVCERRRGPIRRLIFGGYRWRQQTVLVEVSQEKAAAEIIKAEPTPEVIPVPEPVEPEITPEEEKRPEGLEKIESKPEVKKPTPPAKEKPAVIPPVEEKPTMEKAPAEEKPAKQAPVAEKEPSTKEKPIKEVPVAGPLTEESKTAPEGTPDSKSALEDGNEWKISDNAFYAILILLLSFLGYGLIKRKIRNTVGTREYVEQMKKQTSQPVGTKGQEKTETARPKDERRGTMDEEKDREEVGKPEGKGKEEPSVEPSVQAPLAAEEEPSADAKPSTQDEKTKASMAEALSTEENVEPKEEWTYIHIPKSVYAGAGFLGLAWALGYFIFSIPAGYLVLFTFAAPVIALLLWISVFDRREKEPVEVVPQGEPDAGRKTEVEKPVDSKPDGVEPVSVVESKETEEETIEILTDNQKFIESGYSDWLEGNDKAVLWEKIEEAFGIALKRYLKVIGTAVGIDKAADNLIGGLEDFVVTQVAEAVKNQGISSCQVRGQVKEALRRLLGEEDNQLEKRIEEAIENSNIDIYKYLINTALSGRDIDEAKVREALNGYESAVSSYAGAKLRLAWFKYQKRNGEKATDKINKYKAIALSALDKLDEIELSVFNRVKNKDEKRVSKAKPVNWKKIALGLGLAVFAGSVITGVTYMGITGQMPFAGQDDDAQDGVTSHNNIGPVPALESFSANTVMPRRDSILFGASVDMPVSWENEQSKKAAFKLIDSARGDSSYWVGASFYDGFPIVSDGQGNINVEKSAQAIKELVHRNVIPNFIIGNTFDRKRIGIDIGLFRDGNEEFIKYISEIAAQLPPEITEKIYITLLNDYGIIEKKNILEFLSKNSRSALSKDEQTAKIISRASWFQEGVYSRDLDENDLRYIPDETTREIVKTAIEKKTKNQPLSQEEVEAYNNSRAIIAEMYGIETLERVRMLVEKQKNDPQSLTVEDQALLKLYSAVTQDTLTQLGVVSKRLKEVLAKQGKEFKGVFVGFAGLPTDEQMRVMAENGIHNIAVNYYGLKQVADQSLFKDIERLKEFGLSRLIIGEIGVDSLVKGKQREDLQAATLKQILNSLWQRRHPLIEAVFVFSFIDNNSKPTQIASYEIYDLTSNPFKPWISDNMDENDYGMNRRVKKGENPGVPAIYEDEVIRIIPKQALGVFRDFVDRAARLSPVERRENAEKKAENLPNANRQNLPEALENKGASADDHKQKVGAQEEIKDKTKIEDRDETEVKKEEFSSMKRIPDWNDVIGAIVRGNEKISRIFTTINRVDDWREVEKLSYSGAVIVYNSSMPQNGRQAVLNYHKYKKGGIILAEGNFQQLPDDSVWLVIKGKRYKFQVIASNGGIISDYWANWCYCGYTPRVNRKIDDVLGKEARKVESQAGIYDYSYEQEIYGQIYTMRILRSQGKGIFEVRSNKYKSFNGDGALVARLNFDYAFGPKTVYWRSGRTYSYFKPVEVKISVSGIVRRMSWQEFQERLGKLDFEGGTDSGWRSSVVEDSKGEYRYVFISKDGATKIEKYRINSGRVKGLSGVPESEIYLNNKNGKYRVTSWLDGGKVYEFDSEEGALKALQERDFSHGRYAGFWIEDQRTRSDGKPYVVLGDINEKGRKVYQLQIMNPTKLDLESPLLLEIEERVNFVQGDDDRYHLGNNKFETIDWLVESHARGLIETSAVRIGNYVFIYQDDAVAVKRITNRPHPHVEFWVVEENVTFGYVERDVEGEMQAILAPTEKIETGPWAGWYQVRRYTKAVFEAAASEGNLAERGTATNYYQRKEKLLNDNVVLITVNSATLGDKEVFGEVEVISGDRAEGIKGLTLEYGYVDKEGKIWLYPEFDDFEEGEDVFAVEHALEGGRLVEKDGRKPARVIEKHSGRAILATEDNNYVLIIDGEGAYPVGRVEGKWLLWKSNLEKSEIDKPLISAILDELTLKEKGTLETEVVAADKSRVVILVNGDELNVLRRSDGAITDYGYQDEDGKIYLYGSELLDTNKEIISIYPNDPHTLLPDKAEARKVVLKVRGRETVGSSTAVLKVRGTHVAGDSKAVWFEVFDAAQYNQANNTVSGDSQSSEIHVFKKGAKPEILYVADDKVAFSDLWKLN
ncbi:MAG: hypothetical protein PHE97_07220, partial [Candidatus Omnitrophica bacterium]|nr:hypothetical protein [Candidatus Omnitrophota bacterium]